MTRRPTLITGGGGGIGRAVATLLRERGNPVAVADLDLGAAQATVAAGSGAGAIALESDVTDSGSLREAVAITVEEFGGLGGLVTCAGMHRPTRLADTDDEFARRLIDVNFLGTFYACREAREPLAAHGSGRIVTIGSDSSRSGLPKASVYSSMKGAVNSLTRSLGMELARDGITVNCVSPGTVDTEMLRQASDVDERQIRKMTAMVPLRRLGKPQDIAATVAFLISDEAGYITAQIIPVNGGIVAEPTPTPRSTVPDGLVSHMIHTCIVCSDFDRSLDFYTRVLGAKIGGRVSEGEAGPLAEAMGAPGRRRWRGAMLYWGDPARTSLIDLISYDEGSDGEAIAPPRGATDLGFSRLCLRVSDVQKGYQHLLENDVEIVSPPIELTIENRLHRILFFRDPDGALLEFSERTGPSHREHSYE